MTKRVVRFLSLILIFSFTVVFLTGCYDSNEVDDITYVTAIGLEKGKTNKLRMTLQYAVPKNFGGASSSTSGGNNGTNQKSIDSITIECPTIYAGLNMINGFLGKKLDLSHTKILVFSEKLAKVGIGRYMYAVTRTRSFRPNMYVVVARGSAKKYINSIKPIQEIDPIKYYELNYSAYKYTGFTGPTYLSTFYNQMTGGFQSPTATLAAIKNNTSKNQFSIKDSTCKRKKRTKPFEGDYYAGDLPKTGDVKSEIFGLAAFNGDKMVAKFDGEESTDYLMVTGQFNYANFSVPDPLSKKYLTVLIMKQARKPIIKININDGKPNIDVTIATEGDLATIQSGINYEIGAKLKLYEKAVDKMFKIEIEQFLNRTQKYNVDICGFGSTARRKFLTWDEWQKYKWLSKYKSAKINIKFVFRVRRTGLKVRTAPVESSK